MDLGLAGKSAIVTGGSSGIGKATAAALAAEGVNVAIAARSADRLKAAADAISTQAGGRVLPVVADTGSDDAVTEMVDTVVAEFGGVDILVNCAATANANRARERETWESITSDEVLHEINVKVLGYIRCIQAAVPHMVANGWGRVINLAGDAARRKGSTVGSIRNAGVVAMSANLAAELGPKGVNVVAVHPGTVLTESGGARIALAAERDGVSEEEAKAKIFETNHIHKAITPEDVANAILFLSSTQAVGITGDVISTGGGTSTSIVY